MTRKKFLITILLLSLTAVFFLPFYTSLYLHPAFTEHLHKDSENSATQLANHLTHYFPDPTQDLQKHDISSDVIDEIAEMVMDFGVEKVKVFSPTGEIIYSTNPADIGTINKRVYFQNVIDKGENFSKIVEKNTQSLEGRMLSVDVVESYVPIIYDNKIIGAVEVYYDITVHKRYIESLINRSKYIVLFTACILLVSVLLTLFRLNRNMIARGKAENELAKHRDQLEALVDERTNELSLANILLQEDIEKRQQIESALRESEHKYRGLIETASDAIFVIDAESGNIIEVNNKGGELLGRKVENLIGLHHSQLHPSDETEKYLHLFRSFVSQLTPADIDYHVLHKDGTRIPVEISTSVMELEGKKIIQGIFRDIRERIKLEEEVQKAQRLESAGIMAGGIAHDFNNLLTAVLGNISLAKLFSEEKSDVMLRLAETEKAIFRAQELTQQLLTFAKGGVPVTKTVDLSSTILESTEFILRGTKLKCNCQISDDLWPVEADVGQINQVIHNLIINAYQVMPDGGECLVEAQNVRIKETDSTPLPSGKYIKISVHDKGVGIPPKNLHKIFDPFFTTKAKGSGLGLSTAYAIVRKHGGLLTVETELGTGSTFNIFLPASSEKLLEEYKEAAERSVVKGEGRILVMDDEEFVREIATELLTHLGYDVDVTVDGKEAIDKYTEALQAGNPYDAVIMDLTIPGGMGGKDAIIQLKAIDPEVKAIVSSGYANDPILADHEEYGFKGTVPKPYKIEKLSRVLHEVLKKTVS
jgi:PAS domain S-box-containing protein